MDNFIAVLKEWIIPTYPYLCSRIENDKAIFPEEWDQIISAFKEAHVFKLFVPAEYGGQKSSDQEIYFMMGLLGYASPGLGIIFVSHGRAIDVVLSGTKQKKKSGFPGWLKVILGQLP